MKFWPKYHTAENSLGHKCPPAETTYGLNSKHPKTVSCIKDYSRKQYAEQHRTHSFLAFTSRPAVFQQGKDHHTSHFGASLSCTSPEFFFFPSHSSNCSIPHRLLSYLSHDSSFLHLTETLCICLVFSIKHVTLKSLLHFYDDKCTNVFLPLYPSLTRALSCSLNRAEVVGLITLLQTLMRLSICSMCDSSDLTVTVLV